MALYIDCAYLNDIRRIADTVPLAGVTTNPTLMLQAQERGQNLSPESLLTELLRSMGGTIFIQPGENEVLLDMVTDPQTDEAIQKFTQDWQKLYRR